MIFRDFLLALRQLPEQRFRRVLLAGIALTLALLAGISVLFVMGVQVLVPNEIDLPLIGTVEGLATLASWGAVGGMLLLSIFLMVPVASVFTGLFLDRIAEAVEARHYPYLPPAPGLGFYESVKDAINFICVLMVINALALLVGIFVSPAIPVIFWCVNGYLLGREYFTLAAARRIGLPAAREMRVKHKWQVFAAGVLMAVPLSVPLVSLVIPVLGAATFTHMYHRLSGTMFRK